MFAGQAIAVKVSGDPTSSNNGIFYFHNDHLGSTSVLTKDSDGYVLGSSVVRYYPFGGYRDIGTQDLTDRGYTGHKENLDIGLIYMNARFYVPYLNRFLSADTIVPDPTNPQSFNRYSYVDNNPINYSDPSGHCKRPGDCLVVGGQAGFSPNGDALQVAEAYMPGFVDKYTNAYYYEEFAENVAGLVWEPADWAIAASDGLQWYDGVGMLPIIPAAWGDNLGRFVSRYSDEALSGLRFIDDITPIANRVAGGTGKAYDRLNGQGLYVLLDEGGNVAYVGRGDAPARLAAHQRDPVKGELRGRILAENNLSYEEARGLEQLLIDYFGKDNLLNIRNGINPINANRDEYLQAGLPLLDEILKGIGGQ